MAVAIASPKNALAFATPVPIAFPPVGTVGGGDGGGLQLLVHGGGGQPVVQDGLFKNLLDPTSS